MVPIIIDLDPDDFTPMKNKQNLYIPIHYTGNKTDSARNNAKYFKNGKRWASAHYFVDPIEIVQIVRDSDASWGVGKKYGNARLWGKCTNANSINIEMCSTNGKIDDATMKNTADLVRSLMARYNIPIQNVVRHYDVCAKRCPGWDGWLPNNESEWNRLIAMIQNTVPTSAEERQLVPVPQPSGISGVLYKVTTPALNIRADHNASSAKRGCIRDMGTYTITEICGNWGKLASGMGWINLSYTKPVGGSSSTPASTPQPVDVTYRVNAGGKWWSDIKNCNDVNSSGYAGVDQYAVSCVMAKVSQGTIKTRVRILGKSNYLSWVDGYNVNDFNNGYAGEPGRPIDRVQFKLENCPGHEVMYRVSLIGTKGWCAWVKGTTDFAGIDGNKIDKVQVKII